MANFCLCECNNLLNKCRIVGTYYLERKSKSMFLIFAERMLSNWYSTRMWSKYKIDAIMHMDEFHASYLFIYYLGLPRTSKIRKTKK